MVKISCPPGKAKVLALSAATFCLAATAAQAQLTAFATGFDGMDTVNGVTSTTTYASPDFATTYASNTDPNAVGPTAPLASQNGWTSNDATGPIGHGVVSGTNANQINGGTTYVGGLGASYFSGSQAGVVGGIYAPPSQTPDAVPSTGSNGTVNLSHGLTVPVGTTQLVFNVDFAVLSPGTTALGKDSFSFTLANTSGVTIFSFNMFPTKTPGTSDDVTTTGATTIGNANINLNASYHLQVTLTPGALSTYAATLTGSGSTSFNGVLAINPTNISQFMTVWKLTDTTTNVDGGLTGAGNNYLAFDNISATVPEPSTDAMLALGVVGLAGALRRRRRQA